MKYFSILFVVAVSLISVNGKIPSYIHICKASDPQLNKCITDTILNLKDKLAEGIPELSVPSIDPLYLDKLALNLGTGFKAEGRELLLRGGKSFEIHNLVADIAANTYSFTVKIPEIVAVGTYEIDAAIASIPLKGKGPINLTAKSVTGEGTLHGRMTTRGGKIYNWFPTMNMKLDIADYSIKLENLFEGDPAIGEVTNKLLNEEKTEVLASLLPGLEKALIEHILQSANNICKNFSWDELFLA